MIEEMIEGNARVAVRGRVAVLGLLLAALTAAILFVAEPARAAGTFTVNSTADTDDGQCTRRGGLTLECTLREAINTANSNGNAAETDLINFQIGGTTAVKTISPTSELPVIRQPVIVDGYTQAGATPNTATDGTTNAVLNVVINGSVAPARSDGLTLGAGAGGSTIRGLVINFFRKDLIGEGGRGIVMLDAADNSGNRIEGNFIGTDASGTAHAGNATSGVVCFGRSTLNTIGGTEAGKRNLISANGQGGVVISSDGNRVENNLVGTDKNGTDSPTDLGNAASGISVFSSSNNVIKANRVAFNGASGVPLIGTEGAGNRILSNEIFANALLGIDLGFDGPTANDFQDPDTGINGLQNKPVLASAETADTATTIRGKLNSTPGKTFLVQFFSNPSGNEGKVFRGQKNVTTDAQGNVTFSFATATAVPEGQTVTATATGAGGTSEFSAPETVVAQ